LSAIGPTEHRKFCQIDGWSNPEGTNHDKWEKRLANGRLLRTSISRNKTEYGDRLKGKILIQLEVDEATFREVIRSGQGAERPAPEPQPKVAPLPIWAVSALIRKHVTQSELAGVSGM
jgi:hypothetical protein